MVERGDVLRLQRVLVLGVTRAPAHAEVLCGLQEQARARESASELPDATARSRLLPKRGRAPRAA